MTVSRSVTEYVMEFVMEKDRVIGGVGGGTEYWLDGVGPEY